MQKWEYKAVGRKRVWLEAEQNTPWFWAGAWAASLVDDLESLGEEGWELVAVTPRSGVHGGTGNVSDYAGFTTEELWVFKRPKP